MAKKYIDAEKLLDIVIKMQKEYATQEVTEEHKGLKAVLGGQCFVLTEIIRVIDSLQQEQPEMDLEKDVESWFFNEISHKINVEHTMYHYFQECAQRYFELGKNSK